MRTDIALKQFLSAFLIYSLCLAQMPVFATEHGAAIETLVKKSNLQVQLIGDGNNTNHCQLVLTDPSTGESTQKALKTLCISKKSLLPPANAQVTKDKGLFYSIDPNPPAWAMGIIKSAQALDKSGKFENVPIHAERRLSTITQLSIWRNRGGKDPTSRDAVNAKTVQADLLNKAHVQFKSLSSDEKKTLKNRVDLICEAVDLTCKGGASTEEAEKNESKNEKPPTAELGEQPPPGATSPAGEPDTKRADMQSTRQPRKSNQTSESPSDAIANLPTDAPQSAPEPPPAQPTLAEVQSAHLAYIPQGTVFVPNDREQYQDMMCLEDTYIDCPGPGDETIPVGNPPPACPPKSEPDQDCCIVRIVLTNDHDQAGTYEILSADKGKSLIKTGTVEPGATTTLTGEFGKCVQIKFRGGGNTLSNTKVCCNGLGEQTIKSKIPGLKVVTTGAGNCGEKDDGPGKEPEAYGGSEKEKDPIPLGIYLKRDDDSWIPKNPSSTTVTARIYEKRNKRWVPSSMPCFITFSFEENYHSKEKGECLNSGKETNFDLFFDPAKNETLNCLEKDSSKYCSAMKTKNKVTRKTIVVSCEDWGAFSKINASADEDGCVKLRRVGAELEECTKSEGCCLVSVPKDDNNNQIADAYEDSKGQKPLAKDDKDSEPTGNGKMGDGFSAYEEYRGFRVRDGSHERTSWTVKDLFIHDRDGLTFGKYPSASGIACHPIKPEQYAGDESRVVNFNRGHATLHEQHGLLLVNMPLEESTGGLSEKGPPKNVQMVRVDKRKFQSGTTVFEGSLGSTVGHELGHATGIVHHNGSLSGEGEGEVKEIQPLAAGTTKQAGVLYSTKESIAGQKLPHKFFVGKKGNNTSGDPECLMSYSNRMEPRSVYELGEDYEAVPADAGSVSRSHFCTAKTGLKFNKGGHCAGDARGGECKKQIVVNDE